MQRRIAVPIVLLVALASLVAGCATPAPTAVPTKAPTAVPTAVPTAAPTVAPTTPPVTLKITGLPADVTLTSANLAAMTAVNVPYTDKNGVTTTYAGATLADVLKAASVTGTPDLTLVAGDGFTYDLASADYAGCADCIIAPDPAGGLRSVFPKLAGKAQVRNLVEMQVKATPALKGSITVFAAASLTESFTEIGKMFEAANPGVKVVFNFAGSQALAQQLDQAAPADVFASANNTQMNAAIASKRIADGTQQTFVKNQLVVIYPKDNPAGIKTLQDLTKSGLKIVLAAKEVPVGQYSLDFLDKAVKDAALGAGYKDAVLANVVSYEQNVKAVLTKIVLGEGDAGIVYISDISQDSSDKVGRLDIPDALNTIATYPIAQVSDSAQPDVAKAFVDFVMSSQGQATLAKYNFVPAR